MSFERSVFINCPFDDQYIDNLLKPILYVIVKNKFIPRLALEVSDSGQVRLEKITQIIKGCKYSIHDISIVKAKEAGEYARMNMPFELGIDYGLRNCDDPLLKSKQFLILEAHKYDYMRAISDISGFDVKVHGNETYKVFQCLYSWFSETLKVNGQAPPRKLFYDFMDFNASLFNEKYEQFGTDELAQDYIKNISIPEYISEISERVSP
jgi:hypothetical protein